MLLFSKHVYRNQSEVKRTAYFFSTTILVGFCFKCIEITIDAKVSNESSDETD